MNVKPVINRIICMSLGVQYSVIGMYDVKSWI